MQTLQSLLLLLALGVVSLSARANEPTPPISDTQPAVTTQPIKNEMKLSTSVVQVLDRRSSIDSILNHCTVELRFTGQSITQVIGVDHIEITHAVDDLNNSLIEKRIQANLSLGQTNILRNSGNPVNRTSMSVMLKNPPRTATQIKLLKGQVSFVLKTNQGKDYVRLTDFMQETGKPIESDALKNRKVQVTYLPPQWIKDWATQQGKTKNPLLPADELAGLLPLIQGISQQARSVTLIPLFINDPQKQLAQIQITTTQGNLRQIQFEHIIVFVSFTGPLTQPTLEINLKSDQTIMTLPFEISQIPLP